MFPTGFPTITFDESFFAALNLAADDLDRLQTKLRFFREPLKTSLALVVIPSITENFRSGGRPTWKALAESTVFDRGNAGPILVRTGKLMSAAISVGNWEVTEETLSIDNLPDKVSYAGYNQFGTKKMPARPYILFQDEDINDIVNIFEVWVEKQITEVWGA